MKKSALKIFTLFLIALTVVFSYSLICTSSSVAFASDNLVSDVLTDLQQDNTFNKDDYPINQTDFSLKLIQLAEAENGSLIAYVYQPSAGKYNIVAKHIRISVGENYQDFSLTLLDANGQFFKYIVVGYATDPTSTIERQYKVVQLDRVANVSIGDIISDENNNNISTVVYPDGYTYTAVCRDGDIYYGKYKSGTITVTAKYVGQLYYSSGLNFSDCVYNQNLIRHYIAFDTDLLVEDLQAVDIRYDKTRIVSHYRQLSGDWSISPQETEANIMLTITAKDTSTYKGGLFTHKYQWERIQSVDEFVQDNTFSTFVSQGGITQEGLADLTAKKWVVSFTETPFTSVSGSKEYYDISNVSLLRLNYITDGVQYDLGVVDNYQSGDGVADNKEDYGLTVDYLEDWINDLKESASDWLRVVLIVLGVVALIAVSPFIIKFFGIIIKIVTAPFRRLFGRKRGAYYSSSKPIHKKRYGYGKK